MKEGNEKKILSFLLLSSFIYLFIYLFFCCSYPERVRNNAYPLPPNICAKKEQTIRIKPASLVMNAAKETAGLACTSGKLTDLKA